MLHFGNYYFAPMEKTDLRLSQVFVPPAGRRLDANISRRYFIERAKWVWHPQVEFGVSALLRFTLPVVTDGDTIRLHISADRRFEFFVDEIRLAAGPASGDPQAWPFHSYDLTLPPGKHLLRADVWWLSSAEAPEHRMGIQGGYICAAEGSYHPNFSTGEAPWQVQRLAGWKIGPGLNYGVHSIGGSLERDLRATSEPAVPVKTFDNWWDNIYGLVNGRWQLEPVNIPDPREQIISAGSRVAHCNGWLSSARAIPADVLISQPDAEAGLPASESPLTIPADREISLLLDFKNYLCGYPEITVSGGRDARVEFLWAESLILPGTETSPRQKKGRRDEVAGKCFYGFGDVWILNGESQATLPAPHWWRAGRYALLRVRTQSEPLTVHSIRIRTTGYPWLVIAPQVQTPDLELEKIFQLAWNGFTACTHDAFMDCPYYEQLMYVADARVMMLSSYALAGDDRLARRCIELFDFSRRHHGLPAMRYPSQHDMVSPSFALWWIGMVDDFARWRRDRNWVSARLAGVRATLTELENYRNADGLLENLPGWPFVDWGTPWDNPAHPESFNGIPTGARAGISAILNFHYLWALRQAESLEKYAGIAEMAGYYERIANKTHAACRQFFDAATGLMRDYANAAPMSEHAQAFALLAGLFSPKEISRPLAALAKPFLPARASTYFLHHVFAALALQGRGDAIFARLAPWREMLSLGLLTPLEEAEPSRSDCHGWGCHPVYHYVTGIIGLRPAEWEFRSFILQPALGKLSWAEAVVPHPDGEVQIRIDRERQNVIRLRMSFPPPLKGTLIYGGENIALSNGRHDFKITSTNTHEP